MDDKESLIYQQLAAVFRDRPPDFVRIYVNTPLYFELEYVSFACVKTRYFRL